MKRISVVALIALMAVMMVAAVAQATTLTLQSSHTLTPTVTDTTSSTTLIPTGGSIQSGVDGNSYFLPNQNPIAISQDSDFPNGYASTVSSSYPSFSWLQTTTATTTTVPHTGAGNTFTMSQNYVASAPNPSGGDGYFIQNGSLSPNDILNVATHFSLTYTLQANQNYHVGLVDAYSFLYQLVNSTGAANYFDTTYGKLLLYATITYSGGSYDAKQYIVGASAPDSRGGTQGTLVPNFSLSNDAGTAILGFDITKATAGTLSFEGYLVAEDYGNSYAGNNNVPAPPTLLLLGSGLVGLLALRRRRKVSKS